MGAAVGRSLRSLFKNKEVRIIIQGLDAAGKTTMLYRMKLGEVVTTIPTIGFNVETVEYKHISFTTWDVGGRDKIRPLWRHYYPNTDALVYVVDSNDRDRIEHSKEELHRTLAEDGLESCVLLVMANKQDLPDAMGTEEVVEKLGLHSLRNRKWYITATSALKGEGIYEGLDWLAETLKGEEAKKVLTAPVQKTVEEVTETSSRLTSALYKLSSVATSWWTQDKSVLTTPASS